MECTRLAFQIVVMVSAASAVIAQPEELHELESVHLDSLRSLAPPTATRAPAAAFSLRLEGDLALGGSVFKDGYRFLHSDGGPTSRNTALGINALVHTTPGDPYSYSGTANTALGVEALLNNTSGFSNTAAGVQALRNNTEGSFNTAIGSDALVLNTTGYGNSAAGSGALSLNTIGSQNTAAGSHALFGNWEGSANTAMGFRALMANNHSENTAVGSYALTGSSTGAANTALGYTALMYNVSGDGNLAAGSRALLHNETGSDNVAVGHSALWQNKSGSDNVAIGHLAGQHATGDNNIYLQNHGFNGESGAIRIGVDGTHSAVHIAGIFGQPNVPATAVPVWVDASGRLGTAPSSRRFKEEIEDMGLASRSLLALRPVTFHYKDKIAPGPPVRQYGLIAEEVAEVMPQLVVFKDGEPLTVRYEALTPMLLNEIQRLARRVEELETRLAQLPSERERLREVASEQPSS